MTALEQLAQHLAGLDRGELAPARRKLLALHVIDNVGAWIAGAGTDEGRALVAFRAATAGDELARNVATHCALARLSEIDNIHLTSATTPGGIVVPAALTIAASLGSDAATLGAAIIAGTEAMVRIGQAIGGPTVLYRGIWPTYFAAPVGVAAVAARLFELDARQTAHALAAALSFAAPGVGHHNAATTSRWFAIGNAARNGLDAARAALAGFTSDLALIDGPFLEGAYGIKPDLDALTADLGKRFILDEVSFKPWCAARQTMAATQALKEIIAGGVSPQAITAIEVCVPPPYRAMIDHGVRTGDRASHLTSTPYHLALAAYDPNAVFDVAQSPRKVSEAIHAFMQKVSVAEDNGLLTHYPKSWPARLTVHSANGAQEKLVLHVPGDPQRPLDDLQITDKFRRVNARLPATIASAFLEHCSSLLAGNRSPLTFVEEIARMTQA